MWLWMSSRMEGTLLSRKYIYKHMLWRWILFYQIKFCRWLITLPQFSILIWNESQMVVKDKSFYYCQFWNGMKLQMQCSICFKWIIQWNNFTILFSQNAMQDIMVRIVTIRVVIVGMKHPVTMWMEHVMKNVILGIEPRIALKVCSSCNY